MLSNLNQFRARLIEEKENETYAALQSKYGVNQFYLHEIIHKEDYQPPAKICAKLGIAKYSPAPVCTNPGCEGYREPHVYDCRTQTVKAKRPPKEWKQPKRYRRGYAWLFEQFS